jgi:PAS domain S-box-containing protein
LGNNTGRYMQIASADLARSALDAAPDAMIIIDAAGIVQFANRQVSVLFGFTNDQIVGQSVEQLMPQRFQARHVSHRLEYFAASRARPMGPGLTLYGQRHDGSEFPVEISLSPIQDANRTLVAAAIRDITDRKRVEADLRVARETSERARAAADRSREVADHARELADRARDSADRANQAKSRFLTTASHDLRQPLQTLALLNGALRRLVSGEEASEVLVQQQQAIDAVSRLLNALLDISKLESGAVKPQAADFAVADLFEGLRREFAGIATSKGLNFQLDPSDAWVHSDLALVEQIMKNLVANAIKYTREGGLLLRAQRQDESIRIDVVDTGIGIAPAQLRYIYDEFYQVGVPANSPRDGYGLGLSIVQRVVRLLNLRLEVSSRLSKGSVFSLFLPVGGAQRTTMHPATVERPVADSERKPRVLLVEDDPAVRDATCMLLKVEGYRVVAVASAAEALKDVREHGAPELLISDYHLRDGELGTPVIAAVGAGAGADVKAVLMTGDTSNAIKQIPDDPHLRVASKPVNAQELLALLKSLLEL